MAHTRHLLQLGSVALDYLEDTPVGAPFWCESTYEFQYTIGTARGVRRQPQLYAHDIEPALNLREEPGTLGHQWEIKNTFYGAVETLQNMLNLLLPSEAQEGLSARAANLYVPPPENP